MTLYKLDVRTPFQSFGKSFPILLLLFKLDIRTPFQSFGKSFPILYYYLNNSTYFYHSLNNSTYPFVSDNLKTKYSRSNIFGLRNLFEVQPPCKVGDSWDHQTETVKEPAKLND